MIPSGWKRYARCLIAGKLVAVSLMISSAPGGEMMANDDPEREIITECHRAWKAVNALEEEPEKLEPSLERLEAAALRFRQWQKKNPEVIYWRYEQEKIELLDYRLALGWMWAGNPAKALAHLKAEFARDGEEFLRSGRNPWCFHLGGFELHARILGAGGKTLSIPRSGYQVFPVPSAGGKPSYVFVYRAKDLEEYGMNVGDADENDHRLLLYLMAPDDKGSYAPITKSQMIATKGQVAISHKVKGNELLVLLRDVDKIVEYRGELGIPIARPSERATIELKARTGFLEQPADAIARMAARPD